ncbi:N1R/p28-like protein [Choristoneura biennis entomopoxvirus]|uniref:N1R/p28-like protein n=1 Tax=Choristoneura biennis entomopoxvirus TaxID=10288 RepID=A0A916KPX0_CBEPV|nr:anti-repressor Ant [Choristoneura biennis entomopoxvirus]CCU55660.1 N1R/p28-like protein [Choristoneura biennis entomopoxvirus]
MENLLIKTNDINELNYSFNDELDKNFIENFNEIFKFNNKNVKIVGSIDKPYFRGKDILDILGYNLDRGFITKILSKLPEDDKNSLISINNMVLTKTVSTSDNDKNISYNEGKEIYVTEGGLYYLIMNSKLESAKGFKNYVFNELLPSVRKRAQKKYLDIINNKQDKIDELINVVKKISIDSDNQKLEISKISMQNQLALSKLQELGINLIETKEELTSKIDKIIVDRNVKPKEIKYQHKYLLLKNKNNNNEFKFIRAQDKYIKTNKSIWLEKYNIIIEEKYNPNPIDLCTRLKNKINEIDIIRINNIKNKIKDKNILKERLENRKSFIEISGNNFILNRCDEDKFINIIKSVENEQFEII